MKTQGSDRSAALLGRRGIVLFVAGALAMGLGVTGVHAALGGGSSSVGSQPHPTFTLIPAPPVAQAGDPRPTLRPIEVPSSQTPNPNRPADGIYPTYIHAVDVEGATITVDVIKVFEGEAAHRAAIEDGKPWVDLRYGPVYIRNGSPMMRTLPVARDVRIKLIGVCVDPDRQIALRQLRRAITPFSLTFYYDVSVVGGLVEKIRQFVAVAGC